MLYIYWSKDVQDEFKWNEKPQNENDQKMIYAREISYQCLKKIDLFTNKDALEKVKRFRKMKFLKITKYQSDFSDVYQHFVIYTIENFK